MAQATLEPWQTKVKIDFNSGNPVVREKGKVRSIDAFCGGQLLVVAGKIVKGEIGQYMGGWGVTSPELSGVRYFKDTDISIITTSVRKMVAIRFRRWRRSLGARKKK